MYYLHLDGKQDGPFSYEHLRAGWRDGSLRPDTLFWQEGMEEWQPLETLRKQFETAPPAVSESPDAAAPMIIAGLPRFLSTCSSSASPGLRPAISSSISTWN
jgi:hypothetical protein